MTDEELYWRRFRAYVRRRSGCQGVLLLGPVLIGLSALWTVSPGVVYAVGDPRGDLLWRLAYSVAFLVFYAAIAAYAVLWLLADRRGEKRPHRDGDAPG